MAEETISPTGKWVTCDTCFAQRDKRIDTTPLFPPTYTRLLLRTHPWYCQLLGLIDVTLEISQQFYGFTHMQRLPPAILDGPLITWTPEGDRCTMNLPDHVQQLLTENLLHNPLYTTFTCMLEREHPRQGVPIVPSSILTNIVGDHIQRGPLAGEAGRDYYNYLSTLTLLNRSAPKSKSQIYHAGELTLRSLDLSKRVLRVLPDGLPVPGSDAALKKITLERAMFPFLFLHGEGSFKEGELLTLYCQRRCNAWLTPFTLYKPYLLLMHQMRQAYSIASQIKDVVLDDEIARFNRNNPGATDTDALRNAAVHTVPPNVTGTPGWYRTKLKELLAMVQAYGMPHLFLTLTADEVSETRWQEVIHLEAFLQRFNTSFTWKDAPVECTKIFLARFNNFWNDYIVGGQEILGRVKHHMIRFEAQERGSLHAHIVLWLHPNDVESASNQIMGYIPGEWDEALQQWKPPSDPHELALQKWVLSKNIHVCHPRRCCSKGPCKYKAPWPVHYGTTTTNENGAYVYYRPGDKHRFVVAYHPIIALLWGAHHNIQRVCRAAWSYYMLKYATKCELHGELNLDPRMAAMLGMEDMSTDQLCVISALCLSQSVSPAIATLTCLQIAPVKFGEPIEFVDSSPPNDRRRVKLRATLSRSSVSKYTGRPAELTDVTFPGYFKNYLVTSEEHHTYTCIGYDDWGMCVHELPEPRVVRFTDFHPVHHTEGFFYNVLLHTYAFTYESQLLSPGNKSYYNECKLRGLLRTEEDLERYISKYTDYHLYQHDCKQKLCEEFLANRPLDMDSPEDVELPPASQVVDAQSRG